ncbi:MAG: hypothetical protein IV090_17390 [Candidatus Sericytochromatia bacterium]|nr:hypothetical protein [Candidatus Sericytochromatia bacterium]
MRLLPCLLPCLLAFSLLSLSTSLASSSLAEAEHQQVSGGAVGKTLRYPVHAKAQFDQLIPVLLKSFVGDQSPAWAGL